MANDDLMTSPELEATLKDLSKKLTGIEAAQASAESIAEGQKIDRHKLNNQLSSTLLDVGRRQIEARTEISALTESIETIKKSTQRMETALLGDEAMGNAGLVRRMDRVEESTENLCDRVAKVEIERSSTRLNFTLVLAIIGSVTSVLMLAFKIFGK